MPILAQKDARRQPAVAGTFYPRDTGKLSDWLDALLRKARTSKCATGLAIIAPHAGYAYSGPVAAESFAAVKTLRDVIRRAVIIGPAHYHLFNGIGASSAQAFITPLGEVPVDQDAIDDLVERGLVHMNDEAHAPEHALEVELPFLKKVLGDLPIVPLVIGQAKARDVANVLNELWDETTLLIISSDLSHYLDYETAKRLDEKTANAIETLDDSGIGPAEACGWLAVRGLILAAKERGSSLTRLDLRNSGDTAGDKARVVGYGAWAVEKSSQTPATSI